MIRNKGALDKTTVSPLGVKPSDYRQKKDDEETQLLALGQIIFKQIRSKISAKRIRNPLAVNNSDYHEDILDSHDVDWEFIPIISSRQSLFHEGRLLLG